MRSMNIGFITGRCIQPHCNRRILAPDAHDPEQTAISAPTSGRGNAASMKHRLDRGWAKEVICGVWGDDMDVVR